MKKEKCKLCGREREENRLDKWGICCPCAMILNLLGKYPPRKTYEKTKENN